MNARRFTTHSIVRHCPRFAAGILIAFLIAGFFAPLAAQAESASDFYVVQKHDTLTTILYSLGISPLWGKRGAVAKIVANNEFIRRREKSPDLIFPGEKILIPDDLQPKVERNINSGFVTRTEAGRIDFNCADEGLAAWSLYLKSKYPAKDPFDPRSRTLALRCERNSTLSANSESDQFGTGSEITEVSGNQSEQDSFISPPASAEVPALTAEQQIETKPRSGETLALEGSAALDSTSVATDGADLVEESPAVSDAGVFVESAPLVTDTPEPVQTAEVLTEVPAPVESAPLATDTPEPIQDADVLTEALPPVEGTAPVTDTPELLAEPLNVAVGTAEVSESQVLETVPEPKLGDADDSATPVNADEDGLVEARESTEESENHEVEELVIDDVISEMNERTGTETPIEISGAESYVDLETEMPSRVDEAPLPSAPSRMSASVESTAPAPETLVESAPTPADSSGVQGISGATDVPAVPALEVVEVEPVELQPTQAPPTRTQVQAQAPEPVTSTMPSAATASPTEVQTEQVHQPSVAPVTASPSSPTEVQADQPRPTRLTSRIGVLGSYSFSAHDSVDSQTGASARILSKPTIGLGVSWDHLWTSRWESRLAFATRKLVVRNTVQGQITETSVDLSGFEFSALYRATWADLRLVLSQSEEAYVRAPLVGAATVEALPRTRLGLILGKQIFADSGLSVHVLGGSLFGLSTGTTDYTVNADRRDLLGFRVNQSFTSSQMHFQLTYSQVSGSSSISTSQDRELMGILGMDFDLGGGAR